MGADPATFGLSSQGLAGWTGQTGLRRAARQSRCSLPNRPPVWSDDLHILRVDHCQSQWKGRGLLRVPRREERACDNRLLVRRALVERVILAAVRDRLAHPENLDYVFKKLGEEVANAASAEPETVRLKEAELDAEQQRVSNFIEFVAEGRGSRAVAKALATSEKRLEDFRAELEGLRRSEHHIFTPPPREWLTERMVTIQKVLERRTARSALLLRRLLGKVKMEPVTPDIGRPYYRALTNFDALAVVENDPDSPDSEPGSTTLQWWRRRESNWTLSVRDRFQRGNEDCERHSTPPARPERPGKAPTVLR